MAAGLPTISVLDKKQSHILKYPLTVKQQIWLSFIMPTICISAFYVIDISTDLAIGLTLIKEGHIWAGGVTLALQYIAPLITYLTLLSNPPPENELQVLGLWFLLETAAFILYPLRPLYCFGERIFWAIEALRLEDPLREQALVSYEGTKRFSIEHYLFLQGIVHAGPQSLFQLILVILGTSKSTSTEKVQIICILSSLATLSLITMSYHRYETQINGGRKEVWSKRGDNKGEVPELLLLNQSAIELPIRKKWTKVIKEDDPLGKTVLFLFWYLFLFGRFLCLTVGAVFFPWVVVGLCLAHYIFILIYILPSSGFTSHIPTKLLLSLVYIFCLIEVGLQYRKSQLFYILFIAFCLVEDIGLTLLWAICASWYSWWYHYSLYLITISHILALIALFIYIKYFKPQIKRVQPNAL